jgi:hypothetical protein
MTTGLVTAKEWSSKFSRGRWIAGRRVAPGYVALEEFRDIQRNALEAAAKAVCTWCRDGYAVSGDRHRRTHVYGTGNYAPCNAAEIWALIPENPAPAVKRRPGDMTIARRRAPTNDGTYVRAENPAPDGGMT